MNGLFTFRLHQRIELRVESFVKANAKMNHDRLQPLPREAAETLALTALGWIAGQEDLAAAFLGSSGVAPEDLKTRASDPEFMGFVLDFLLQDEPALLAFCEDTATATDRPLRARAALPGGDLPHWT